MRNTQSKKIVLILAGLVIVGFIYYAVSPLFKNIVVDDALPESVEDGVSEMELPQSGVEDLSEERREAFEREMDNANKEKAPVMNEQMPSTMEIPEEPMLFSVMPTAGHPAEGEVRVIETSEGTIARFENYKTINGPNLHVYLSNDLNANDFVDLGRIRGTEGNINYKIPSDINIEDYRYIMVWCVPFGVLFHYAEINP